MPAFPTQYLCVKSRISFSQGAKFVRLPSPGKRTDHFRCVSRRSTPLIFGLVSVPYQKGVWSVRTGVEIIKILGRNLRQILSANAKNFSQFLWKFLENFDATFQGNRMNLFFSPNISEKLAQIMAFELNITNCTLHDLCQPPRVVLFVLKEFELVLLRPRNSSVCRAPETNRSFPLRFAAKSSSNFRARICPSSKWRMKH